MSDLVIDLSGLGMQRGRLTPVLADPAMQALQVAAGALEAQLQAGSPTAIPALEHLWTLAQSLLDEVEWGHKSHPEEWSAQRLESGTYLTSPETEEPACLTLQDRQSLSLSMAGSSLSVRHLPGESQTLVFVSHDDSSQTYSLGQDGRVLDESAIERGEQESWNKAEQRQDDILRGAVTGHPQPTEPPSVSPLDPGLMSDFLSDLPGLLSLTRGVGSLLTPQTAPPSPSQPAAPPQGLVCPECSQSNASGSHFCAHCGHSLELPKTHLCPGCAQPVPEDARFCPHCGKPIASTQCPHCHTPIVAGAHFCSGCGQTVSPS